ncbi:phosphatase PAP2 family protein [bacterium]|nr:phosphatase PAP2 family protein [bacterium]
MKDLRSFIRAVLVENIKKRVVLNPPPSEKNRVRELDIISKQYKNRKNPEELQRDLDANSTGLFDDIITSSGSKSQKAYIKELKNKILPSIMLHKMHFDALRPAELAKLKGIPFKSDYLSTANSPSYPSGHTAQAFYIANVLSDMYPSLSDDFYRLAEMIANSRIDRGVHFPSDNEAGKLLADILYKRHKDEEK